MKRTIILASISLLCLLQTGWGQVPRTISYQGVLKDDAGNLINDSVNLAFSIYAVASEGTALWSEPHPATTVTDGVFSVILGSSDPLDLDFDVQYWLEIAVNEEPLSLRTELTAVPYALIARNNWSFTGNSIVAGDFLGTANNQALDFQVNNARALRLEPNAESPNVIGGHSSNSVTGGYGATISGGGASGMINQVTQAYGTIGGGINNTASNISATVSGGGSNTASGVNATVGGGANNTASASAATVGGGESNTASVEGATVGGGGYNRAHGLFSVVSGGGGMSEGESNSALGYSSAVGGGQRNTASGGRATVGGGFTNTASVDYATVGGGSNNTASGSVATVGGGYINDASGDLSTVGGGFSNTTSGKYATVPGGSNNTASGHYSFAAGRQAKANHTGTFVWADSTYADFASTGANEFAVRATGGFRFLTSTDGSGLRLEPHATSPNVIGGHSENNVTDLVMGATIGGGGRSGYVNQVTANYGTVGGGFLNTASAYGGTVGGGMGNTASTYATVGGGNNNNAGGNDATIGGGISNTASGLAATIGGGNNNNAGGEHATVPGGRNNTAGGGYSFAAGRRAKANHGGSFVWADSTANADFASTAADQFLIRAAGGVGIGTADPQYELDVIGDIRATGSVYYGGADGTASDSAYIKPDYVFEGGYEVMTTEEVEKYLKKEGHLPWMTSVKQEREENGEAVNITRMAFETVETAENLQLQIIELTKLGKEQQREIEELQAAVAALRLSSGQAPSTSSGQAPSTSSGQALEAQVKVAVGE